MLQMPKGTAMLTHQVAQAEKESAAVCGGWREVINHLCTTEHIISCG